MDEYIGSRGRTRLKTVPYLAGEGNVPARWYAEMGVFELVSNGSRVAETL